MYLNFKPISIIIKLLNIVGSMSSQPTEAVILRNIMI